LLLHAACGQQTAHCFGGQKASARACHEQSGTIKQDGSDLAVEVQITGLKSERPLYVQ
jgi:hypothetical protein